MLNPTKNMNKNEMPEAAIRSPRDSTCLVFITTLVESGKQHRYETRLLAEIIFGKQVNQLGNTENHDRIGTGIAHWPRPTHTY